MKDNLKLLTKDYFNHHPVKEMSPAMIEYALVSDPKMKDAAENIGPILQKNGLPIPDDSEQLAQIAQEEDTEELIRMLRKSLYPSAQRRLREKLLSREEEALPAIQRLIRRSMNDNAIENCTHFLESCQENCTAWIIENYGTIRAPYAKSMLCLVLGFRAAPDVIPFLMRQVNAFETQFPDESFEQGPLLALYEIRDRFRTA